MLTTPIAFIIFNRPDLTEKVFAAIRMAKPARIYIIADGPRFEEESILTNEARKVTEMVDWPCEVTRQYSEVNLGCKQRVITGLNAVFEAEEHAIILEDDCLPDQSFFTFCQTLLERYKYDETVMHISGNNFQLGQWVGDGDYYFSRFSHIWGWATWKRAWHHYSIRLHFSEHFFEEKCNYLFGGDSTEAEYWKRMAYIVGNPDYSAWSFHWQFAIWFQGAKCILPNRTLVENIGFGGLATHTHGKPAYCRGVSLQSLNTINPPTIFSMDADADRRSFYRIFFTHPRKTSLWQKIKARVKQHLK